MQRLVLVGIVLAGLCCGTPAPAGAAAACPASSRAATTNTWLAGTIGSAAEVDWFRFSTSSARYAAITLGHLGGNLALRLYDGSCRELARSDHPGRRYERIYRSIGAGRYFVRVAGVSGATGRYALDVKTLGAGVQFVDSYAAAVGQYLHITGELVNNTAEARSFVQVTAKLYDRAGRVLATGLAFTTLNTLGRHVVSPFDLADVRPSGYDHYRLTVHSQLATAQPVRNLQIEPKASFGDAGFKHFPGTVVNHNDFPARYVEVVQSVHNAYGTVIAVNGGNTDPATISAGGRADYDLYAAVPPNANGMSYAVQAQR